MDKLTVKVNQSSYMLGVTSGNVFDQKGSQAFSITNYGNGDHIHE